MKFWHITITLILFSSNLYAINVNYPPKHWWGDFQSIQEIELENDEYITEQLEKFRNVTISCTEKNTTLKEIGRVNSLPCDTKKNHKQGLLDNLEMWRLSKDEGWKELKALFLDGDEIRSYSAPRLSGGFGYILTRKGVIIHVFERGQQ